MPAPFRTLIFCRPIKNGVEILTVLHGARESTSGAGAIIWRRVNHRR